MQIGLSILSSILLLSSVTISTILMVLMIPLALYFCYWFYFGITRKMAHERHRDPLGWILLSFFLSPLIVWILLLIVGDKQ